MNAPKIRQLQVLDKSHVTPNMIRVRLGGENISTVPANQEGGYVKLIFETENSRTLRTYTIRKQTNDYLDIDFVVHGDAGPASSWASECQIGDLINIGGPGPAKLNNPNANWHLIAGDMTALPAIAVNLESLPEDAIGYALIEVLSEQDIQEIKHPSGIEIQWLINDKPGQNSDFLLSHLKKLKWLEGQVFAWAACEFNSMKALRSFIKAEKQIAKEYVYLSSYWKLGINEEQHKDVKRVDAEQSA